MSRVSQGAEAFVAEVARRNPNEPEFLQAVKELVETVYPYVETRPELKEERILERLVEPERIFIFRVPWTDDQNKVHINRGFRVQMNSALGPYKGGLRFHPSVNLSILKFLAFEQTFKNALTTLPLGSGKGGSDFDPKGRSDREVMRFCQSFMTSLYRHIGSSVDVPAGDVGVGKREIGYMFGQYRRITKTFSGILTGKDVGWGGSLVRSEATGYGCVYFSQNVLHHHQIEIAGKRAAISGAGNVAQYAAEKLTELGAKVLCMSDSRGYIHDPAGIDEEKLEHIKTLKNVKRTALSAYTKKYPRAQFVPNERPWSVQVDLAYPCATQNELELKDAKALCAGGCLGVFEGANMPTTPEAIEYLEGKKVLFCPGKASNAGGVATSGLEIAQNAQGIYWKREKVDQYLQSIMKGIHESCVQYGANGNRISYVRGANIAGFIKVADAMLDQGVI